MKKYNIKNIKTTLAHNQVPRKALVRVGEIKNRDIQTVNDAWLEPGKGFSPHIHSDCEEFYYILEGKGEISIDRKKYQLQTGDFILIEKNEEHAMFNNGTKNLRYITVRYLLSEMTVQPYPQVTVGAFIMNKKGELFLVKTHKWPGLYVVPGGKLECGETLKEALKREVKEETGLDVGGEKLLTTYEFINEPTFWQKKHYIFFEYLCLAKNTKVVLDKKEATRFVWISPAKALELPLEKYTKKVITKYLYKPNSK